MSSAAPTSDFQINQPPELVFTGAMDYQANVDGVCWFYDEIWPRIIKEIPNVTFTIVGSNPAPAIKKLDKDNRVKVTGFVKDIRPYYDSATLCIVPLRIARGIQNKVLEAMAMGKALVCTANAAEGITAATEENMLLGNNPTDFAQAVITLLKDKTKRKTMGLNNRQCVESNYNWESNLSALRDLISPTHNLRKY